jgi:hypothetical protein
MWQLERIVLVEVYGSMAGCAMAGVAAARGLKLFPWSVPLRMEAGLTSADTVTAFRAQGVAVPSVLMQENVDALLEVAVQECSRGGMACCRNWFEAGHLLAELGGEMRWVHWFSIRS